MVFYFWVIIFIRNFVMDNESYIISNNEWLELFYETDPHLGKLDKRRFELKKRITNLGFSNKSFFEEKKFREDVYDFERDFNNIDFKIINGDGSINQLRQDAFDWFKQYVDIFKAHFGSYKKGKIKLI